MSNTPNDIQAQGTETNNQMTSAEVYQLMLTISAEQVQVIEKIETSKSDQKRDIIRDLSNAGLALLGGVLTLATVGQQFIRTPTLVYIGTLVVALSVILAFFFRIRIGRRFTQIIDKEYNDYSARANAIRGVWSATPEDRQRKQYELDDVIIKVPFTTNKISKSLSISEIVVGLLLVSGALLTVLGLVVTIIVV